MPLSVPHWDTITRSGDAKGRKKCLSEYDSRRMGKDHFAEWDNNKRET